MKKIYTGDGFAIIENEGVYTIEWAQGPFNEVVSYVINQDLADKAMGSSQDAYEVMVYVQTGKWPIKNTEDIEKENIRIFIRKFPELLITVPENQALFSTSELKELLPLAEKKLQEGKNEV